MASFLFSPANSEDLSTGNYYIHLVNSVPSTTYTTANQLNTSDAINYAPIVLTGLVYDAKKWTFSGISFPAYTFNTIPVGIVICKRLSNNSAPSDPILYYADIQNVLAQPIVLTTGKYSISIVFPSKGLIVFSNYYQYYAGAYVNTETIPKGLMYLLGTRNDTQSFLSPLNNALIDNVVTSSANLFNRQLDNLGIIQTKYCFNFGSRRIKIGTTAFWLQSGGSGTIWSLFGSNIYTTGSIDIDSDWTLLSTSNSTVVGINFMTSTNQTYWKYIKLVCNGTGTLQEIEFYDSSMYSTDADLMSTVIDSPFDNVIADNSGFNHVWTTGGVPIISNNSLYLNGNSRLDLPSSPILNLTNRNFKFNMEMSAINNPYDGVNTANIFGILGLTSYFSVRRQSGTYQVQVGSFSVGSLGTPTSNPNLFDSVTITKTGSSLVGNLTATTSNDFSAIIDGVNTSNAVNLGHNDNTGQLISGFIRNFKLVT